METNCVSEPFGEFEIGDKIQLLRAFCDQLLLTNELAYHREEVESKCNKIKEVISDKRDELCRKLDITTVEFNHKKQQYYKQIEEST